MNPNFWKYLLNRGKEASTWAGIVMLAAALGYHITAEQSSAFVSFGLTLVGLIKAFAPDKLGA